MDYVLSTNCLTKQFKQQKAVDNVSLHIAKGQIFGFIGKNGAGKTTFMNMVGGLSTPTSGELSLFGYSGEERKKVLSRVGVLIEAPGLYPNMSAYDNLKLKGMCVGIKKKGYLESILQTVGLENTGKKKVRNFSLGMKQRLGIGMALTGEPDLLLLDEPINGLDPQGMAEVRNLLLRLNREMNLTILVSSHILGELSKIATNYGIIHNGQLIKELTSNELQEACSEHIEIKLPLPGAAVPVLDELGFQKYKVTDANTIQIQERMDESGRIAKELAKKNIWIDTIFVTHNSLEDYFLHLTGGVSQ